MNNGSILGSKETLKRPKLVELTNLTNLTGSSGSIKKKHNNTTTVKKFKITFDLVILVLFILFFIFFLMNCREGMFKCVDIEPIPYYFQNT